jgi:predicted SAM-dependent methyltransferase
MANEPVRVWLAMDPEHARLLLVVNRVPVGTVTMFANMPDTLRAALYEAPGFVTNTAGRDAVAALAADRKRRVHLGCGPDVRPGWLNIDYLPGGAVGYNAGAGFLNYDLRQGLPGLEDGSVDVFFSSHFFEHLRHEEAMTLMQQARRAVRDDGMARFQMPDFKGTFRAYVDDDRDFLHTALDTHHLLDQMPEFARNWADVVSRSVYESYTHKYIWDPENLSKALIAAGFREVEEVGYDAAMDHPSDIRREYSYYLVARP